MRAMILAAGRGQRLAPLTDNCPKPLVPVLGKPLIVHQIERLRRAGITEVVINIAYLKEQIENTLQDGADLGVNIQYSHEDWPALDVAGGVANALPLLGNKPFLLVSADIYTDYNYQSLTQLNPQVAHLVMVPNPPYHHEGDFGLDHNVLTEKAPNNSLTYANIGVYQPQFFASLPQKVYPLSGLLVPAIRARSLTAEQYHGLWANVGTLQELHTLEQSLLGDSEKRASI